MVIDGCMETAAKAAFFSPGSLARQEGVHPSAVYRWIDPGLKTRDGRVVRLPAMRRGGRLKISAEDWEAFLVDLNSPRSGLDRTEPTATDSEAIDTRAGELGL